MDIDPTHPEHWSAPWRLSPDSERQLFSVLRRRRRLRAGLIQLVYVAVGVVVGVTLPEISTGPTSPGDSVRPLLYGMAGGLISFIALVFSLLFLVVQYGNTSISPRLTLFRDDPLVAHCFGFFAAVFVYCTVAGIRIGSGDQVSVLVATVSVLAVVVSFALARRIQMRALKLLQFNSTMEEIRKRGESVIRQFYREPDVSGVETPHLPPVVAELRWEARTATLEQIDLAKLVAEAERIDAAFRLHVRIGGELRRRMVVVSVLADHPVATADVFSAFSVGPDRTFTQDPLLAFRLLSDVANRALSSAINDPETAVHALGCVHDLLAMLVDKRLEFGAIRGADGTPRVLVVFPSWDDFVTAGYDEIATYASRAPTVSVRLDQLVDDLAAIASDERRAVLIAHRDRFARSETIQR